MDTRDLYVTFTVLEGAPEWRGLRHEADTYRGIVTVILSDPKYGITVTFPISNLPSADEAAKIVADVRTAHAKRVNEVKMRRKAEREQNRS